MPAPRLHLQLELTLSERMFYSQETIRTSRQISGDSDRSASRSWVANNRVVVGSDISAGWVACGHDRRDTPTRQDRNGRNHPRLRGHGAKRAASRTSD